MYSLAHIYKLLSSKEFNVLSLFGIAKAVCMLDIVYH